MSLSNFKRDFQFSKIQNSGKTKNKQTNVTTKKDQKVPIYNMKTFNFNFFRLRTWEVNVQPSLIITYPNNLLI